MAEQFEDRAEAGSSSAPPRRRILRRILGVLALLLLALAIYGWFAREELADDLISSQLDKLGLQASYEIETIGPRRQVLTHIVVGDPARPDLTIERAEISLVPRFPLAGIGRLRLVRPRLYGSFHEGKLSFGALDKVLFEQPLQEPIQFPDMDLAVVDGRALLESDYGAVGFKAQGNGNLRDGFAGVIAANAPKIAFEGCNGQGATLFGKIMIDAERPAFSGPLRLAAFECSDRQLTLRNVTLGLEARLDRNLKGLEGKAELAGGALALAGNRLDGLEASSQFGWRKDALTARYTLAVSGVDTPQLALARLSVAGSARSREGFTHIEVEGDVEGTGLRPGKALDVSFADAAEATSGTLLGPMLAQVRMGLAREGRHSSLSANLTLRKTGEVLSLVMPQARLRGSSGETVLALSRVQLASSNGGPSRFSGNFTTGGAGLPRISGRMEGRGGTSDARFRLKMADYEVAGSSLAVPELVVSQGSDGAFGFTGEARASGPIPGGSVTGLTLPISGNWSAAGGLSLWRNCADVEFDRLELANLALDHQAVSLCPPAGSAIVQGGGAAGTRIAATASSLDLAGRLGESPIRIRSGRVGMSWPGDLAASDVEVALGQQDALALFRLSRIEARMDSTIDGHFTRAEARLAPVPLDMLDASGEWRYADGRLEIAKGAFRLEDREKPGRFEPLVARDASLSLADNRIAAEALLRDPGSDRAVTRAIIRHDLDSGAGHADLKVDALVFDDKLQPDRLTGLALGLIANAYGTVTGAGEIDWNADSVTSRGAFSTDNLDFAAAFGPVQGVSGTLAFTGLLGMVTGPGQRLHITSFNPGIEVEAGEIVFELQPDYVLQIEGGRWPFLGGFMVLEPMSTRMNVAEPRHYTLGMEGIDAARFVQRMDLANIAATGKFDGRLPLVFDENGGRIEDGHLKSRPPGGNLAYVGGLTYEDLSPIANFAFDALRSLDFREMDVLLNGPLTGEIVTKVRFEGIKQGGDAKQNIVTRQLARLPIRFNVNIRAPFYRLISSFQEMYDPAYTRDAREVGLLDEHGNPVDRSPIVEKSAARPQDLPADEAPIQPPASETTP